MSHLRSLIADSVDRAILEGEATGVLLSGGLDSSTIAIHAPDLPTFTGYYEGEPYDERRYAHLVRGPQHHDIQITPEDFVENFDDMLESVDPPYAGTGMLGQYMVAKYAANHVDALLSGEGGDELFGGYARLMLVAGEQPPDGYEGYALPEGYPTDLRAALDHDFSALENLVRLDAEIAFAHGLFVSAPLLDPEVVEYVLVLPAETRVRKRLLKQAMSGLLPDEILNRPDKRGFPTPFVEWAQREPVKSFVLNRIGYVPDPDRPWDRGWWNDMLRAS